MGVFLYTESLHILTFGALRAIKNLHWNVGGIVRLTVNRWPCVVLGLGTDHSAIGKWKEEDFNTGMG